MEPNGRVPGAGIEPETNVETPRPENTGEVPESLKRSLAHG